MQPGDARVPAGAALLAGCGALVVLALAVTAGGVWWLVSSGPQVATTGVVGEAPLGILRVGDLGRDAGARGLVEHLAAEIGRLEEARQPVPGWLRGLRRLQPGPSSPGAAFCLLLPREATLTWIRDSADSDARLVAAVNPRGFSRLFATLLRLTRGDQGSHRYRGHTVRRLDRETTLGFVGGTMVLAGSPQTVEGAIDRLTGPPRPAPPQALEGSWDVWGAFDSRDGFLAHLLGGDDDPAVATLLGAIDTLAFGVDVVSADDAVGELTVTTADAATAGEVAAALDELAATVAAEAAEHGLTVTLRTAPHGPTVRGRLAVHGLAGAVSRWADAGAAGGRGSARH